MLGILTHSHGGLATGRCGGHAQASRQTKHYAHKGILMEQSVPGSLPLCRTKRKYVQQHIRICTLHLSIVHFRTHCMEYG